MDNDGIENAAILMMALGEEEASAVLRHLAPKDVQRLGEAISGMKAIPRERVTQVLDQFSEQAAQQHSLVPNADDYVRRVLRRALGDDKAKLLIDRIVRAGDMAGMESLKWMDADSVAGLLRLEHPQIVAAILVHLDIDQAAAILKLLEEGPRNDVLLRIATLDGIAPVALDDLNDMLSSLMASGSKAKPQSLGGPKAAASLINTLGAPVEATVLDFIREADAELAQRIADNMFIFDDLAKLDDKGMQAMLKEVQSEALVVALKGASPALSEKVFKNMSSRAADTLREDLESKGPVRLSEVEAQQKEILKTVRRLVEEGQVVLTTGGSDAFV